MQHLTFVPFHYISLKCSAESEEKIRKEAEAPREEINPLYICSEIEKEADDNATFVADGGDFVGTAAYILRPRGPFSWMDPG